MTQIRITTRHPGVTTTTTIFAAVRGAAAALGNGLVTLAIWWIARR
ncbi:hypothetical protein [Streptomyces melanogenes]